MGLEPLPVCGWPTFPSVLWCCWLGLLTCKTVSRITYTVLVETLNPAQSNPIGISHLYTYLVSVNVGLELTWTVTAAGVGGREWRCVVGAGGRLSFDMLPAAGVPSVWLARGRYFHRLYYTGLGTDPTRLQWQIGNNFLLNIRCGARATHGRQFSTSFCKCFLRLPSQSSSVWNSLYDHCLMTGCVYE